MKRILIIALISIIGFGFARTYYMKKEVASWYNLSALQELAAGTNANLPMLVDASTRLEKVTASEGVLEKHFTLIGVNEGTVDKAAFSLEMTKLLKEQACSNETSKKLYRNGVSEWFSYSDGSGRPVAIVKLNLASCQ